MSYKKNTSRIQSIITAVLGVAFSLVALAVTYGAFTQNTEGRSKAAQEQTILKQWEFNGRSAEGWEVRSPNRILIGSGYLSYVPAKPISPVEFLNTKIATVLPKGLKSITFSLAVGAPLQKPRCPAPPVCSGMLSIVGQDRSSNGCDLYVCAASPQDNTTPINTAQISTIETSSIQSRVMCPRDVQSCPDGSYVSRTGDGCSFGRCPPPLVRGGAILPAGRYTGYVYYKLSNKNIYEKPLAFTGVADGKFREITVQLPEIQSVPIGQIRVLFSSGVRSTELVKIDWIRLLAPGVVPSKGTPTPTLSCRPRPTCAPGTVCNIQIPRDGSVICPSTPTPTTCGPIACPMPTSSNCRYINGGPCTCGTLICNVLTSTPTPTVSPTGTPILSPTPTAVSHFIKITSPNGGETYVRGQTYTITWSSSRTFSDVSLYYSTSTGFSGPISTAIADTGSFSWQVNPVYGNVQYKIFINGNSNGYNYANDTSDGYINVVAAL